jgi:hypothetical protein
MIAIGSGYPSVTFDGWCDILQSNNQIIRKTLDDQGIGNQTLITRGQKFEACELNITGSSGALSLRLLVDDDVVFERRTESVGGRIVYDAGVDAINQTQQVAGIVLYCLSFKCWNWFANFGLGNVPKMTE